VVLANGQVCSAALSGTNTYLTLSLGDLTINLGQQLGEFGVRQPCQLAVPVGEVALADCWRLLSAASAPKSQSHLKSSHMPEYSTTDDHFFLSRALAF
jgi:hypothetical protein